MGEDEVHESQSESEDEVHESQSESEDKVPESQSESEDEFHESQSESEDEVHDSQSESDSESEFLMNAARWTKRYAPSEDEVSLWYGSKTLWCGAVVQNLVFRLWCSDFDLLTLFKKMYVSF